MLTLTSAKKIKADLIAQSKLKREYAKVLKEEGMESTRLKPRGQRGEADKSIAEVPTTDGQPNIVSPTTPVLSPSSILRHTQSGSSARPPSTSRSDRPKRPEPIRTDSSASKSKERKGLSPADIGPPMPQTSLRELKKEAYKKYHRPRQPSTTNTSGGRAGAQPNLGARMGVLLEKIKRDRVAG